MIVPAIFFGNALDYNSAGWVGVIGASVEKAQPVSTIILLVILEAIIGYRVSRYWYFVGLSSILFFYVSALIEVTIFQISHNLIAIEFLIYPLLWMPALLGAFIGSRLKINRVSID